MATAAQARPVNSMAPAIVDYVIAIGTAGMLLALLLALAGGRSEWSMLPLPMWIHIATLTIALALTPIMMLRARGDRLHRTLGKVWVAAMATTAGVSFFIPPPLTFSPIFILSVMTLIVSYKIVSTARAHQWEKHRFHVRGIAIGGLIIAGYFTFQFDRILDRWLGALLG